MKLKTVEKPNGARYGLAFLCPGCRKQHMVNVDDRLPRWEWNGDYDKPTFRPSIKTINYAAEVQHCCHSFVRDGNIQFLSDCTHALRGQTMPLPEIE